MKKKDKKNEPLSNVEIWNKIRRDWGNINPVTQIIENKKRSKRPKHKKKALEKEQNE